MAQTTMTRPDVPKDPAAWSEFIRDLQAKCFVVGPMTDFRALPDGFEVRPNYVMLEVGQDSFKVGTEGGFDGEEKREMHALTKSGIEKLSLVAGAVAKATRTDDRKNPLCCEFEAIAQMKLLDGSPHFAGASRAYDLTPEGQDYVEVYDKAYEKAIRYPPKGVADVEKNADFAARRAVAAARATMTRNAETKSKLRALRTLLGLRSKYAANDLRTKPFVVLKLHFHGRSADPQMQRMMTEAVVHSYLGASSALFGALPHRQEPRALAAPAEPSPQALPHEVEPDVDPDVDPTTGEVATPAAAAPAPERVVPKGLPGEGRAIDELDDQVLEQLQTTIMQRLSAAQASGKVSPERLRSAETFLDAVTTLRDARRGPGASASGAPGSDDDFLAGLNGEGAGA